jgi:hydroxymethylpyrimidine pyrophosphatase-like HAD family hydrolase
MLAPEVQEHAQFEEVTIRPSVLTEELGFYEEYGWCLNPHLTVSEAHEHLGEELEKLSALTIDWQRREAATNVYLLACGILNTLDEHLRGKTLRLPGPLGRLWAIRGLKSAAELLGEASRWRNARQVHRWREAWVSALGEFLPVLAAAETPDPDACACAAKNVAEQLRAPPPASVRNERVGIPSPFQRLDLTHLDVLALGQRLMERLPDRRKPILLIGLRTSGSYFAPLMKAALEREGYDAVALATLEPNKGAGRWEMKALRRFSSLGYTGVIVDDPPYSGGTILVALEIALGAGFHLNDLRVVAPTHPAKRDWLRTLSDDLVITLPPEHWHKQELLQAKMAEAQLLVYFGGGGCSVSMVESERAQRFTAKLQSLSSDERAARLKRVYEVRVEAPGARAEVIFVLAKSVGWGWLSYHAFIAARRLADFVPPLLGLRDGILYTQYIPPTGKPYGRHARIDTVADYVAARSRSLSLAECPVAAMDLKRHNNGVRLLEKALSRAYGRFLTDTLMRSRVGARLRRQPCLVPTCVDGNMQQGEWIAGADGLLKTDYEHHGMGKAGLNVIDPAYDLADAILDLELSREEESRLIRRYVAMSGDAGVGQRLYLNKLLAGIWNMNQAQEQLLGPARDGTAFETAHQRFIKAWNFLTVETARYIGQSCEPARQIGWHAPLILLDVDGVIDQRLFGFPATTAAGVQALSKLTSHDCSVALNTARSVAEVKGYCAAYFLAGGVAEYGSYIWDALRGRGRVLIDAESARQMETFRGALQKIPGVFLDSRHLYSIRAFTYCAKPDGAVPALLKSMKSAEIGDGAVAPLSPLLVKQVMTELGLDRLRVHNTTIDTTIVARDVDKGTGLVALRDWVLRPDSETIAVGDSEADLAMFHEATRSFAPGNIGCARKARLLGCEIVPQLHQQGLLEIACRITGSRGKEPAMSGEALSDQDQIMAEIFSAADKSWTRNLFNALRHPSAFRIFFR